MNQSKQTAQTYQGINQPYQEMNQPLLFFFQVPVEVVEGEREENWEGGAGRGRGWQKPGETEQGKGTGETEQGETETK